MSGHLRGPRSSSPTRPCGTYDAGHIHYMIEMLLPHLADALQPLYWTDFTAAGGGMFGDYLAKREDEVCGGAARRSPTSAAGTRAGQ